MHTCLLTHNHCNLRTVLLLRQTRAGMTSWVTTEVWEHLELTSKTFSALTSWLCASLMSPEQAVLAMRAGSVLKWWYWARSLGWDFLSSCLLWSLLHGTKTEMWNSCPCAIYFQWRCLCKLQDCKIRSCVVEVLISVTHFSWCFCPRGLPIAMTYSYVSCYEVKFLSVVHRGEVFHRRIHGN